MTIQRHKIFYGWWIVGLGFLAQFIGIGVSAYATSIFFQFMFTDLKWSRGDLALSMSVGSILAAIASPFVGAIVDRHGAGRIMAIGAFTTGICLILLGFLHELWQAFIVFSLVALFRVGFVAIPGMTMVSNWFVKKRGRALGIMTAGQGMGGLILSPLTTLLISESGWRMAWTYIGVLTMVVMIPSALLLAKAKPEVMGLAADGVSVEKSSSTSQKKKEDSQVVRQSQRFALRYILKMPVFWLIAFIWALYLFGHVSLIQHGYSLFTDKGIQAVTAGTMIGILGFFSLSGKIVLGYLSDRIPLRYVLMIALAIASVSIVFLFMSATSGAWLFIVFWGFFECGIIALQPILVANTFDRAIVGKMLGIFTVFTVFPQIIGPAFTGYVFDNTGSYNPALFVFIIFYLISLVLVFFLGVSKRSPIKAG